MLPLLPTLLQIGKKSFKIRYKAIPLGALVDPKVIEVY